MRFLLTFLSIAISLIYLPAQNKFANVKEALMSGRNFYGAGGPSEVNWIENGNVFCYRAKKGDIKRFDPATSVEGTLIDFTGLNFPGTTNAFEYEDYEWSKDSKYLLFKSNVREVWRNSAIADYYLYTLADKSLKQVAKDAYTAQISPDATKVAFEREGDLYVTDLAKKEETRLTKDAQPFFFNGRFGWAYEEEFGLVQAWEWSPDSRYIAFWQTDEREVPVYEYTNYQGFRETYEKVPYPRVGEHNPVVKIGVLNVANGKKKWMQVDAGDGYIPRIYWTASSGQLAIVHLNRKQNHMQLYFADINSGEARPIMDETSEQWIDVFSFPNGEMHYFKFPSGRREFIWRSERDGWAHLYRFDYNGHLINQITKGNWEVMKICYLDALNEKIYYTSTEKSPLERQLYVINFDGTGKKQLTTTKGLHSINFASGGEYFIDNFSNTTTPRQVDICNNTGKSVKKWEANEAVSKYIQENPYSPMELSSFTTPDGQKIDIGIVKPIGFNPSTKYPVLFDVYGGPEFQSVFDKFETSSWTQFLAQQGYVIVSVNNRGGSAYGRQFKMMVYGKLGYWECNDFAEAAKYMSTLPWVDKDRICIQGHSYGGFTAAYSILRHPDVFRSAIVGAPVTDWRLYDAIYTERYMGILPENAAAYDSCSVQKYAGNLQGKMLLYHSTSDDNVHVTNSMQLLSKFIENGKDVDFRLYQMGGHGVANDFSSYILLSQQYFDFMEKTLKIKAP